MRPIDLDKALLAVCSGCNEEFSEEPCEPGCCRIREKIENAPALTLDDLRPKGRWIPYHSEGYNPEYDLWFEWECSECRNYFANDEDEIYYNFCPHCGADMRGGGEDA